jgi:hypothetical protein
MASITDLHSQHLAQKGGAFEEQRGNNALITIYEIDGNDKSFGNTDLLTLSLQSFPVPKTNVDVFESSWLNEKRKFAGLPSFDDIEIVFKDFVDIETAQVLKAWHEKVYNPVTGQIGLARDYKKNATVQLFAPDGSFSRFYSISGMFPLTFNPGDIDMTSAEPLKITINFSVDKVYAASEVGMNANLTPEQ